MESKGTIEISKPERTNVLIGWIVLGLTAGFIASKMVGGQGQGFFLDIALGIIGAVVGGFLYSWILGGPGITGVNIGSIIVAIIGAICWAFITRLRAIHDAFSPLSEKTSPSAARGRLAHRPVYYFSDAESDPRIIDKLAISDNQRRK